MRNSGLKISKALIACMVLFCLPPSTFAGDGVEQGLQIMTEVDRRDTGWVDYTVELIMILRNARGETSKRHIQVKSKEIEEDGDRTLLVFDSPPGREGNRTSYPYPFRR